MIELYRFGLTALLRDPTPARAIQYLHQARVRRADEMAYHQKLVDYVNWYEVTQNTAHPGVPLPRLFPRRAGTRQDRARPGPPQSDPRRPAQGRGEVLTAGVRRRTRHGDRSPRAIDWTEKIGAGGEARVFRAHDLETGDDVALRLSPPGRFIARAPRNLPRCIPAGCGLLDRGIDPAQRPFAVFELLHGETLGAMTARGPLDATTAWLEFARQSLDAVGALHAAGWVHGDLNADNFLLHDGTTWKLLELPFHRPAAARTGRRFSAASTRSRRNSSRAAPPESASDLYALGCLYYKAASGVYPHAGGTAAEIAVGRLRFPPTPLG